MLHSIEGIYNKGSIELWEPPTNVRDRTRVIVTFLDSKGANDFKENGFVKSCKTETAPEPDVIDELCGKYRNSLSNSDQFAREKQNEIKIEEGKWSQV